MKQFWDIRAQYHIEFRTFLLKKWCIYCEKEKKSSSPSNVPLGSQAAAISFWLFEWDLGPQQCSDSPLDVTLGKFQSFILASVLSLSWRVLKTLSWSDHLCHFIAFSAYSLLFIPLCGSNNASKAGRNICQFYALFSRVSFLEQFRHVQK